jgi:hypothetical protein
MLKNLKSGSAVFNTRSHTPQFGFSFGFGFGFNFNFNLGLRASSVERRASGLELEAWSLGLGA